MIKSIFMPTNNSLLPAVAAVAARAAAAVLRGLPGGAVKSTTWPGSS